MINVNPQLVLHKVHAYLHVQVVLMEPSGFVVEPILVKDVWRCAGMMPGALCVMISGMLLMLVWCANS